MSNYDSTVQFNRGQSIYYKTEKPSIMSRLAKVLSEQGINAQVVKKMTICERRDT